MIEIPADTLGLVFDCDGTLADTMTLHYESWVEALAPYGKPFPRSLLDSLAGTPTHQTIEILNARHGYSVPVEIASEAKERLFEEIAVRAKPLEPIAAIARRFHGRLPMAVATGSRREICLKILRAMGMLEMFDAVVTADDVKNPKPAPDIYLEAVRQLRLPANRCRAFEDSDLGIQSAAAAGLTVVDVRPILAEWEAGRASETAAAPRQGRT